MDCDSIQIHSNDDINLTLQMGNYFRDGKTKIGIHSSFMSFLHRFIALN